MSAIVESGAKSGNAGRRALIKAAVVVATVLTGSSIATSAQAAYPGENGRILFTSDRTGSDQIYSMRPDGGDVRRLAHGLDTDWSPDGRWIAFDRRSATNPSRVEVFVMRRDGRDVRQITHLSGFNFEASWSPNSRLLVFERAPSSGCCQNIYSIRPDGRALRKLTYATTARSPAEPEFSPDGRWITFEQFRAQPLPRRSTSCEPTEQRAPGDPAPTRCSPPRMVTRWIADHLQQPLHTPRWRHLHHPPQRHGAQPAHARNLSR